MSLTTGKFENFDLKAGVITETDVPKLDLKEREDGFDVRLDVPAGVSKDNVQVSVDKDNIVEVVARENTREKTDKDTTVKVHEEYFHRRFTLPEDADMDTIRAKLEKGMLTISTQKKGSKDGRQNLLQEQQQQQKVPGMPQQQGLDREERTLEQPKRQDASRDTRPEGQNIGQNAPAMEPSKAMGEERQQGQGNLGQSAPAMDQSKIMGGERQQGQGQNLGQRAPGMEQAKPLEGMAGREENQGQRPLETGNN